MMRCNALIRLAFIALLLSMAVAGQVTPVLNFTGAPIANEFAAGATQTYQLTVPAGMFVDLKVYKLGGDAAITVRLPDGKEFATSDRLQYGGFEDAHWISGAGGDHRIEVRAVKGVAVRYRVEAELRSPSEADRRRASGFRIGWADSKALLNPKTGDGFRKLAAQYELAAPEYQKGGDIRREAHTLTELANVLFGLSEYGKALALYLRAIELLRRVPDEPQNLASSLVSLGAIYTAPGENRSSLSSYEEAFKIMPPDAAKGDQAIAISGIGGVYARTGDSGKAIEYKLRALAMRRKIGEKLGIASSLVGIGSYYYNIRNLRKAIEYAAEALPIFMEIKEEVWEARTRSELGSIYAELRDATKAAEYWQRTEEIYRCAGHNNGLAGVLYGMGNLRKNEGDFATAQRCLEEAAALNRKADYPAGLSRSLASLCDLFASSKQWDRVRPAGREAIALGQKIGSP